jgi:hypothetical protein
MPKIVVTHSVGNVDTWLKGTTERGDEIGGPCGVGAVRERHGVSPP